MSVYLSVYCLPILCNFKRCFNLCISKFGVFGLKLISSLGTISSSKKKRSIFAQL